MWISCFLVIRNTNPPIMLIKIDKVLITNAAPIAEVVDTPYWPRIITTKLSFTPMPLMDIGKNNNKDIVRTAHRDAANGISIEKEVNTNQ